MSKIKVYSEFADLEHVKLHYLDTKSGGETIICIHGLWGRGETWKSFMYTYGSKYRVIAPDLRGHGYSDKSDAPYTAQTMCSDILKLMNHLGIEKAIVLGHSQGGRIAAHLAYTYPDRVEKLGILDKSASGLALDKPINNGIKHQDPLTHHWPLPFKTLEAARIFIRDEMNNPLSYDYFMLSLTEAEKGYTMLFSQDAIGSLKANDTNWFHILPEITCKTLLMRTSSHEAVNDADWEHMKSLIKNCKSIEMSHPDHNVHLANPEEFYACIEDFLNS